MRSDRLKLNRDRVRHVLEEEDFGRGFYHVATLYGYDLGAPPGKAATWRLTHAGGISGDNDRVWWVERKNGKDKSAPAKSIRDLRRILREWLASEDEGQRPADTPEITWIARRRDNRFGTSWVWERRHRKKAP